MATDQYERNTGRPQRVHLPRVRVNAAAPVSQEVQPDVTHDEDPDELGGS